MTEPGGTLHRFRVAAGRSRARLDKYLAEVLPEISRSRLKTLIEQGRVRVGGETIAEPAYRVKPGAAVVVDVPAPSDDGLPEPQAIPLEVVYEDRDLIVVDKPAGMVVHPAPGNRDRTLVNALIAHCGDSLSGIGGVRRPGIVHRLDKDTSGLLVAAKNDAAHASLAAQFAAHSLDRAYLAVVWGVPTPRKGRVTGNIGRSPRNRKKMAVVQRGGKPAETAYKVVRPLADGAWSLVECRLATGRTHQIRVHMASLGHPVVGDAVYGGGRRKEWRALPPEARYALEAWHRQALHAYRLGFRHPRSGEALAFESPLPADMRRLIDAQDTDPH